jgi:hypothetical protein
LLVDPTSPVTRELTTANRNPNAKIKTAPISGISNIGVSQIKATRPSAPASRIGSGVSRSVLATLVPAPAEPKRPRAEFQSAERIAGSARMSEMIPPVANAPAPMWRA